VKIEKISVHNPSLHTSSLTNFSNNVRVSTDGSSIFLTANETGLALAQLIYPCLDPIAFTDQENIQLPLRAVFEHLEELQRFVSVLLEFEELLQRPIPPGRALGDLDGRVKYLRAVADIAHFPAVIDGAYYQNANNGRLPSQGELTPMLVELCQSATQNPGIPQRRKLPSGLRIDYLYEPNPSDLPDHKLQLSHPHKSPRESDWQDLLTAWPWPVDPPPRPDHSLAQGRHFLYAALPNPV
jgi:hypothetical protein